MFDLWLRNEDLVMNPEEVMAKISKVLSYDFKALYSWNPEHVHGTIFKLDRHDLLRSGTLSRSRIGIGKTSGKMFSKETHQTVKMMVY